MSAILKCKECGSYGISAGCICRGERATPKPPKYSPEDKYGEYRRKYAQESQMEKE